MKEPVSNTAKKDKCTVAGVVVNMQTGEPVRKATLHLTLQGGSRGNTNGAFQQTGYSGMSGPDGSFKFEGVEPGTYFLVGDKSGFIRTGYGSKDGLSRFTALSLEPGQQMTDLKMQLVAQGVITGRVLDEDGDPVGGAFVQLIGRARGQGGKAQFYPRGQATADETGVFRIASLTPGKYYVTAQTSRRGMNMNERPATPGKPNPQPVRTFYPSSLDRSGASALDVKAGQEIPGVEIHIRAVETFHIRGKVVGDLGENDGQRAMLMLLSQSEGGMSMGMANGSAMVAKDHTFEMDNVPPGQYVIVMSTMNGKFSARQPVEVGSGDVNDVVVAPQTMFTIHGQLEVQGKLTSDQRDNGLAGIYITLSPDDDVMLGGDQGTTKADGSFSIESVTPGKFRVQVFNEPEGTYLMSVRFGNQEVMGKTLDLTQAAGGDMHVVIRAGAAEVNGTVTGKKGDTVVPISGAAILLIPEDMNHMNANLAGSGADQNGAFTARSVAPGTYYAIAYEPDDQTQNVRDPAVLKLLSSQGTKVEVKENDKKQVQLTILPAEELQKAIAASGVEN